MKIEPGTRGVHDDRQSGHLMRLQVDEALKKFVSRAEYLITATTLAKTLPSRN